MPHQDDSTAPDQNDFFRRDATGHLNPRYERELLQKARESDDDRNSANAFLTRPRTGEPLSEELGEAFVQSATTGEEAEVQRKEAVVSEEQGGPFVTTSAEDEFADGTDASNIPEATREPFPRTSGGTPSDR
jgi:hypothetical protein